MPKNVPPVLSVFLRACLEKNPKQRVQAVGDIRLALAGAFETVEGSVARRNGATVGSETVRGAARTRALAAAGWVVAVLALASLAGAWFASTPEPPRVVQLSIPPPVDGSFAGPAQVSPSGDRVAFSASVAGISNIWVRTLADGQAVAVESTDGGYAPFWSPDGRWLAFFIDQQGLFRIDVSETSRQRISELSIAGGGARFGQRGSGRGSWGADDVILIGSRGSGTPLYRVDAAGGGLQAVSTLGEDDRSHFYPSFLPDGRNFLFAVDPVLRSTRGFSEWLGGVDGGKPRFFGSRAPLA